MKNKNLGQHTVMTVYYVNGKEFERSKSLRTVYEDHAGRLYLNWVPDGPREVHRDGSEFIRHIKFVGAEKE